MKDCPCKGCQDRTEGCHSRCERYKECKRKHDEIMKAKRESVINDIPDSSLRQYWRNLRLANRKYTKK